MFFIGVLTIIQTNMYFSLNDDFWTSGTWPILAIR